MNESLRLRQAHISDLSSILSICARTGHNGRDTGDLLQDERIIGQYFAAPYLRYEKGVCHIVARNDEPLGYILGVPDTELFNHWMNREWLPGVRMQYPASLKPKSALERFVLDMIHQDCSLPECAKGYPGHLHIDLLPEIQKQGWGQRLMETFLQSLADEGCPGVHLAVVSENTKAIRFYRHHGFSELQTVPGAIFMGLQI